MTVFRGNAFRMELYAVGVVLFVRQTHDKAVIGSNSGDFQAFGQAAAFND